MKVLCVSYRNISVFIDMDFLLFLYIICSLMVAAFLCVYFDFFFITLVEILHRQDPIGFDKMFYSIF